MVQFRVSRKLSPAHESGELVASKFQAGPPVSDSGCRRPERPPLLPRSPRPQPLVEDEDAGSAGWRRRQSTSCSPRLGLCAALLGQHAVMLAASARRLSAAASSSSSSMRASLLAAALNPQRWMHDRNKKAMELVAKGWSALQEVDRVIDYADRNDKRLIPLLRGAKENFELALEIDNDNTHARYWLGKMHFKYHVPGACKAVGAALLVEAANMGDPDAQYELGCRLRIENDYVRSDQQAFHYIEQAVDQLHPGALYLLGAVYLTGDCVKRDIASALWCFHRASEKGHAGAAVAYGSLLLKGAEIPEVITRFNSGKSPSTGKMRKRTLQQDPIKLAKEQFQIAAEAGCDLGLRWLKRLEDYENQEEKLKQIQH